MSIGVYWQSWSSAWTANAANLDLVTKLDPQCNLVNIAFVNPSCTYISGSKSWSGTGLDFSMDFQVVVDAITLLKKRGVTVMLAVGGSTYKFTMTSAKPVIDLAHDLGVAGIDIDWEPTLGAQVDLEFELLIPQYRKLLWPGAKLSAAVFSTGAYGKNGDTFQGMNIRGLVSHGSDLDWINLMAYDAGPPPPVGTYDPLGAFTAYRMYYAGPIVFGFEPGQQGWGAHVIDAAEVKRNAEYVYKENPNNGIFIWSAQKETSGSATVQEIIGTAADIWKLKGPPSTPVVVKPPSVDKRMFDGTGLPLVCQNCHAIGRLEFK